MDLDNTEPSKSGIAKVSCDINVHVIFITIGFHRSQRAGYSDPETELSKCRKYIFSSQPKMLWVVI